MKPPAGVEALEFPAGSAWLRPELRDWAARVLSTGGTLFGAARSAPGAARLEGRGPAFAIDVAGVRCVVRHYRRGGAVARFLGDRYLRLGPPRPFLELQASEAARGRGVPTPSALAASVHRAGAFYRGDFVSELVPGSRDLADVLFGGPGTDPPGSPRRTGALEAAGSLVAVLGRVGVRHPDLNAKNILLSGDPTAPSPHLIDLDGCRVLPVGSEADASRMLARLERSLGKWERLAGRALGPGEWEALRRAASGGGA